LLRPLAGWSGTGNRSTGHQAKVNLKSNEKRRLKKEIKEN